MNNQRDPNELLKDVFAESASDDFRSALLGQTLQAAGRKKQKDRLKRQLLASFLVLGTALLGLKFLVRTGPGSKQAPNGPNPLYVHSQPLPASMVVTTTSNRPILVSSSNSIAVFQTAASGTYERIGEDKLFTLLGGRPAMVVQVGPGETRFSFLDSNDQTGWPVQ